MVVVAVFAMPIAHGAPDAAVTPAPAAAPAAAIPAFGNIDLTADASTITPTAIIYTNAHMVAQNGATLDADEIRANLAVGGKIDNAVATGHMRAHIAEPSAKTVYNVTADKGVFNPQANRIDLIGNVRAVVDSPMTDGPLVQTGTEGEIYLGKAPEYPKLVMHGVHTTVKPLQQSK